MPSNPVSRESIDMALRGENPLLGHSISAAELGLRLAPHRRGRYPGASFTRAAISLYRLHPEQQGQDFIEAWHSWTAAETLHQKRLRVRMNGMTADEMLSESGYVQQLGDDPVIALLAVGQLPPHTLIRVNGHAEAIECMADVAYCDCGTPFVKRSWNQRRCSECRTNRRRETR